MLDRDRDLLARVAVANPHLAGTVMRLCDELVDGELPPPPLLREFGEHVRDLGRLIVDHAEAVENPPPMVIDSPQGPQDTSDPGGYSRAQADPYSPS